MPIHLGGVLLHTMDGTGLSHVRTELQRGRIITAVSPHPVQSNSQATSQRDLGNASVPPHGQANIATSPVGVAPCRCLRSLYQQEAQQGAALLSDMTQPLLVRT